MSTLGEQARRRFRIKLAWRLVMTTFGLALGIATAMYSFVGLPRLGETTFVDLLIYALRLIGGLMFAGFVLGWLFEWIRANEPKA